MCKSDDALKRLLHEVRSPLAAIYTAGMMMEELPEDTPLSKVRRQLVLIRSCVEEARKMVEDAEGLVKSDAPQEAAP